MSFRSVDGVEIRKVLITVGNGSFVDGVLNIQHHQDATDHVWIRSSGTYPEMNYLVTAEEVEERTGLDVSRIPPCVSGIHTPAGSYTKWPRSTYWRGRPWQELRQSPAYSDSLAKAAS